MSTLAQVRTDCRACGADVRGEVVLVANFDRRDDLRRAVLDGAFNRLTCGTCGRRVVVARTVATFDFGRRSWIYTYPEWAEVHWQDLARATDEAFRRNFRQAAPPALRAVADAFRVRVCFGYDALREQIVLQDAGLDAVAVEAAKVALLAGDPSRVTRRLMLWRVDGDALTWMAFGPKTAETRTTPRAILDVPFPPEIPARDLLLDPFVSYRRWVVAPRPADPLAFDLHGTLHAHAGGAVLRRPFDDAEPQ